MQKMIRPQYGHNTLADVMPAMLGMGVAAGLPLDGSQLQGSAPRVLLVLDGLGWNQLQDRPHIAPNLTAMKGGPITSVAPSTTATALTSLTTALSPGEHGIVGYRFVMDGEVLNSLRWSTPKFGDARRRLLPRALQPHEPFLSESVAVVTRSEFRESGFTGAHLRGANIYPYRTLGTLVQGVDDAVQAGAYFVYAYYDGLDKVAHEFGLSAAYDTELAFIDRLVSDIAARLPDGVHLYVTADHGHVDCGDNMIPIDRQVLRYTRQLSGEGRFRWLHTKSGQRRELEQAATDHHGDDAWVCSIDQVLDERWFGKDVSAEILSRLGDVALVARNPVAFEDPDDNGHLRLIGRHGSLTADEMLVPMLTLSE